jgi:hypothetical protein
MGCEVWCEKGSSWCGLLGDAGVRKCEGREERVTPVVRVGGMPVVHKILVADKQQFAAALLLSGGSGSEAAGSK